MASASRGRLRGIPGTARTVGVIAVTAVLALAAGFVVVSQITGQMRGEAEARLDRFSTQEAGTLEELMASASRDIRLARRNDVYEAALSHGNGQLLPQYRTDVEQA